MTLVSVIILTWNSAKDIEAAIESVLAQEGVPLELIVVDNASEDDTVELVRTSYPMQCRCIVYPENLGFCAGYNRSFGDAKGEFVLVMNPDVILECDYLTSALPAFADPRVGLVGGRLLRQDRVHLDSTGQFLARSRRTIDRGAGCIFDVKEHADDEILSVCGAAAIYRSSMIHDISDAGCFFDEDYFAFHEDLEVGIRAWRAGWKARYVDSAVALHLRSGGRQRRFGSLTLARPTWLIVHIVRNRYLTVIRHDRIASMFIDLIPITSGLIFLFLALLFLKPSALPLLFRSGKEIRRQLRKRRADRSRSGIWGVWRRKMPLRGCRVLSDDAQSESEAGSFRA